MLPELLEQAIAEDRARAGCRSAWSGRSDHELDEHRSRGPARVDLRARAAVVPRGRAYGGAAALVPELRLSTRAGSAPTRSCSTPQVDVHDRSTRRCSCSASPICFARRSASYPSISGLGHDGRHNYSEYGIQLGRRFRALKLWIMIRYFGPTGSPRGSASTAGSRANSPRGSRPIGTGSCSRRFRCRRSASATACGRGPGSAARSLERGHPERGHRGGTIYISTPAFASGSRCGWRSATLAPRAARRAGLGALRTAAAGV